MKSLVALLALLAAGPGFAQPVTENAARSDVASAFITGAVPAILRDTVEVDPALRERLSLPEHPDRDTLYRALFALTVDKAVHVVPGPRELAGPDRASLAVQAGNDVRFVVQYDLRANGIAFVGLPGSVAAGRTAPEPEEKAIQAVTLQPVLFEFNRATLSESARALFDDELAQHLRGAVRIRVTGHADPLGKPEYNLDLSWQRAEAVRDELVALGVAPSRIDVAAAGDADADRCAGEPTRRARIACLAPERRVEIEVELAPR